MKMVVPLEQMTDREIEAEARWRGRHGEPEHAEALRRYSEMRAKHGTDYAVWPKTAFDYVNEP